MKILCKVFAFKCNYLGNLKDVNERILSVLLVLVFL